MSERVGDIIEIVSERYIQKEIDTDMEDGVRRGRTGGEEGRNVDVFLNNSNIEGGIIRITGIGIGIMKQ